MKKGTDENIKGLSDPNISLNIFEIFRLSAKYARWKYCRILCIISRLIWSRMSQGEKLAAGINQQLQAGSWHQPTAASWQLTFCQASVLQFILIFKSSWW